MMYLRHIKYIFAQFIESFRLSNNGNLPILDMGILIMPLLVALSCTFFSISLVGNELQLTICSIYLGFLITMQVPFLNFIENQSNSIESVSAGVTELDVHNSTLQEKKRIRLNQYRILYSQVTFAIVSSLLNVLFIVLNYFSKDVDKKTSIQIVKTINYYFDFSFATLRDFFFLLNFLMLFVIIVSSNAIISPRLLEMSTNKKS